MFIEAKSGLVFERIPTRETFLLVEQVLLALTFFVPFAPGTNSLFALSSSCPNVRTSLDVNVDASQAASSAFTTAKDKDFSPQQGCISKQTKPTKHGNKETQNLHLVNRKRRSCCALKKGGFGKTGPYSGTSFLHDTLMLMEREQKPSTHNLPRKTVCSPMEQRKDLRVHLLALLRLDCANTSKDVCKNKEKIMSSLRVKTQETEI
jgi:hypothetical protein